MVNLSIDDETYTGLQARAKRRGLTVEDWLRRVAAEELGGEEPDPLPGEWFAKLHELARTARGRGGTMDDSRESIYDP
jgi:hypothetical protein